MEFAVEHLFAKNTNDHIDRVFNQTLTTDHCQRHDYLLELFSVGLRLAIQKIDLGRENIALHSGFPADAKKAPAHIVSFTENDSFRKRSDDSVTSANFFTCHAANQVPVSIFHRSSPLARRNGRSMTSCLFVHGKRFLFRARSFFLRWQFSPLSSLLARRAAAYLTTPAATGAIGPRPPAMPPVTSLAPAGYADRKQDGESEPTAIMRICDRDRYQRRVPLAAPTKSEFHIYKLSLGTEPTSVNLAAGGLRCIESFSAITGGGEPSTIQDVETIRFDVFARACTSGGRWLHSQLRHTG
jgi:hypothetical protein